MAFNISERIQQLNQLSEFIKQAKSTFLNVLNYLEWDESHLQKEEKNMVSCPLNGEHRVPQEKLQQHIDSCSWRREGYHDLDTPLPECSGTGFGSITIGKELRNAILQEAAAKDPDMKLGFTGVDTRPVPKTADRLVADFTPDERRAMYDYAVAKIGAVSDSKTDLPLEFQKDDDKKEKPKTILERLAEERDAKRRRVSYRNKKVHTNRKSQTEILREVIQNQMELYEEWLKQENKDIVDTAGSEENENTVQSLDTDQQRSTSSVVVDQGRVHAESSFEDRKIPFQYIAKLRRKRGNPYAIAREISKYLENTNQLEENVEEHDTRTHNQAKLEIKSEDKNIDRYQNHNTSTSSINDENHHRRSRAYEYERSYKSENKVHHPHYYSDRRRNSNSPESGKHRHPAAERYKSSKHYGRSNNTSYESWTKYSEKDRSYSPKREHQSKCESEYKRDRRFSSDTRRSDYSRSYDENKEKRYETSEYRKQGSNQYPEYSGRRKYADTTISSRGKDEFIQSRKHRKEKNYKGTSEKRYRTDTPEYRSAHRKHERHKHRHSSNGNKYMANDSRDSSEESSKYSASEVSSSNESDADKKDERILEHHVYDRTYEDESRHKLKRKHIYEEDMGHHKHKHKKKHKKKKKHIKRENKQESEHSSSDFSC